MMKTHKFTIIASGLDRFSEEFDSNFYGKDCDDATVAFQKGHIIIDFAREAESVEAAIVSALNDVRRAGAMIERIEPDPLVSLSDIAARADLSRAATSHYASGKRGANFPGPVAKVTSDSSLWDWATVARWLYRDRKISRDVLHDAAAVKQANLFIESGVLPAVETLQQKTREFEDAA